MWRKRWDKRAEIDLNRPEIEMEKIRPNSSLKQSLNKFKISSKCILFPSQSLDKWPGGEVLLWLNVYSSKKSVSKTEKRKKAHKVSVPLLLALHDVSMPCTKRTHIVFLHTITRVRPKQPAGKRDVQTPRRCWWRAFCRKRRKQPKPITDW